MDEWKKETKAKQPTEAELMKYEIAGELGLLPKVSATGWKSLTSRESGQIGGILAKRQRALRMINAGANDAVQAERRDE